MLNVDAISIIAEYIPPHPIVWMRLAEVNRNFFTVFTSDKVWERYNVYALENGGIYCHFLKMLKKDDYCLIRNYLSMDMDCKRSDSIGLEEWAIVRPIWVIEQSRYRLESHRAKPQDIQFLSTGNFGDITLYTHLMIPTCPGFFNEKFYETELAVQFVVKLVGLFTEAYDYLPTEFKINRKIAYSALTGYTAMRLPLPLQQPTSFRETQLCYDRDFCLEVLDAALPSCPLPTVLGWFDPETVLNDPAVRKAIYKKEFWIYYTVYNC